MPKTNVMFTRHTGTSGFRLVENHVILTDELDQPIDSSNPLPVDGSTISSPTITTARVSSTLTASFDNPVGFDISGKNKFILYLSYQEGGTNGAVDFQIQISPYTTLETPARQEWFLSTVVLRGTVTSGVDVTSRLQAEYITFNPVTSNDEGVVYAFSLIGAANRMRILSRESGNTGSPGSCEILIGY